MQGTRLGDYEILDKLGEGGMGEVWRARDHQLNRSVAIKILPNEVAADPGRRLRFEQEARALGALNHPNIVAVYGAGTTDGRAWIASELVSGESLRAVIDRGRLPVRRLIDIAVQIAEAMAAAHAAGIVHRDLKPENIMIADGGRVKVLDFGLAKQAPSTPTDHTATMALSQPGTVLGTVGYMSPEQVRGEPADARSDIFSFGAVLYELVAGRRAFQAASSVETMNAILREDPPDLPVEAPPALATILSRCLEKRPDQRFQSAADLAFALRSLSYTGTGSGAQAALKKTRHDRSWLGPALAAVAAVAMFAAGFLLAGRLLRQDPPRFQRITFRKGLVTSARFTADGHDVIFSAQWEGAPARTYLATPGNPEARDLDLPEDSILTSVSSKDDVAFIHGPFLPDGTGTLARSSVSGGQMRPWLDQVLFADWAPDGSSMAVLRSVNGHFRLEYPIGNTLIENVRYPMPFRVSPNGSLIASLNYYQGSALGLNVIDKAGHSRFIGGVSDQIPNLTDVVLTWSPNGSEIWYRSFDPKEWGTLYAMDLKGRRRVLLRIPGHAVIYDVARDGRILLRTDTRQLGILGRAPGDTKDRDLSCLDMSQLSGISADGRLITAVISGEGGGPRGSIYLRKTDGSPPVRLGDGHMWGLSPDGLWVSAYTSIDASTRRYVLLPTGAGEERVIDIPALHGVNVVYGWSADDTTMFVGGPGRNGWQNFLWNSQSGKLTTIGPSGVPDSSLPFVSPDRRQILTRGLDGHWWIYRIDGTSQLVSGLSEHDVPLGWRADNRSIYVAMHHDNNTTMMTAIIDAITGERKPFIDIHPERPVDQVTWASITPDGRAYAYNFLVKSSELYIAEGVR